MNDELTDLNEQIKQLENALQQKQKGFQQYQQQQEKQALLRRKNAEMIDSLRRNEREEIFRIRSLLSFTGLKFTKTSNEIVSTNTSNTTRRFKMNGSSFDIPFELEFDVVEQSQQTQQHLLSQNQQPHPWISSLQIHTSQRPDVENVLSAFFRSIEKTRSLKQFFTVFGSFCQLSLERFELFEKFRVKYPTLISIPNGRLGSSMLFSNRTTTTTRNNHSTPLFYEFAIVWDLVVENQQIRPELKQKITLHPQFDQQSLPEDDENFSLLLQLPSMFGTLVKLNGLEHAIQVVIDCSIRNL